MGARVNRDGSVTIGCIEDVFTLPDVKTEEKSEEITKDGVKTSKPKTTRRTVKK